jgi:hypothetical protein
MQKFSISGVMFLQRLNGPKCLGACPVGAQPARYRFKAPFLGSED